MPFRTLLEYASAALGTPGSALLAQSAGSWRETPAAEVGEWATELAAALVTYGLAPDERVAILTADGGEALLGLIAALRAGGTAVPLDPGLSDAGLLDALSRTSARQALVSDEALLRRVLAIRPELPELDLVLLFKGKGGDSPAAALTVAGARTVGADVLARDPGILPGRATDEGRRPALLRLAREGDEPLLFTDENVLAAVEAAGASLRIERDEVVLSALPASGEVHLSLSLVCLARGAKLAHVFPPEILGETMPAVRPAAVVFPRALAAAFRKHLEAAAGAENWLGRKALAFALRQGARRGAPELATGRLPTARTLGFRVADVLALRRIDRATGGRLARVVSLGEPLPVAESEFFLFLGLPFLEGIALPEAGGLVAMSRPDALRPGTAGRLVSGLEARVGADGALELMGPMVPGGGWRRVSFRGRPDRDGYLASAV